LLGLDVCAFLALKNLGVGFNKIATINVRHSDYFFFRLLFFLPSQTPFKKVKSLRN